VIFEPTNPLKAWYAKGALYAMFIAFGVGLLGIYFLLLVTQIMPG
jgi:uncharacterized membrane protein